jgi:hypothetical protein
MIYISKKLSSGIKFCRVDLYEVGEKVLFGEITLHPGGGLEPFFPESYDKILGTYLDISTMKSSN